MSCLVKLTQKIISENGGCTIYSPVILTINEYEAFKNKILGINMVSFDVDKDDKDIHLIFDSHKNIRMSISELESLPPKELSMVISKFGTYKGNYGRTVAHYLSAGNHKFTIDEIIKLGNQPDDNGQTIAHEMAYRGHMFSMEELLVLGNPQNDIGDSIAHIMALNGHIFSEQDLNALGYCVNSSNDSIKDYMKFYIDRNRRIDGRPLS